jgi:CRISPR-associated protein Csb2
MSAQDRAVGTAARSPYAISRWEIDQLLPVERTREIAAGFCGALLRGLGKAVDEVVLTDRLGVLALPELPVGPNGRVSAVGVLAARDRTPRSTAALRAAVRRVGRRGFDFAGQRVRLKPATSNTLDPHRWVGPARVWTSVTPWVSETYHGGLSAEHRSRAVRASLGAALLGEFDPEGQAAEMEQLVESVQTHDEAWVPGVLAASDTPQFRPGPPTHVRITFREAVEGPIALGRDRLFGMGLLVPVDMPSEPFDE